MPIYEYECAKCKTHVEVMQKMTDKPLTKCVKCGGKLEKQWSSTSFQLKGTGWYVTDYAAKKTEAKADAKETKAATTDEKTSKVEKTGESDSKSAVTKTETSDKASTAVKKAPSKNATSKTTGE